MANVTGGEGVCLAIVGVAPSIVAERCDGAQPAATVTELGPEAMVATTRLPPCLGGAPTFSLRGGGAVTSLTFALSHL